MNLFIDCNFSLPSLYKALLYLIKSETDCLGKKSGTIADIWTYIYFNTSFSLFLFLHGDNFENSNISDK